MNDSTDKRGPDDRQAVGGERVMMASDELPESYTVISGLMEAHNELTEQIAELQHELLDHERLEEAVREQRLLAEAFQLTARTLVSSLELEQVLDRILKLLQSVTAFDAGWVLLVEGEQATVARVAGQRAVAPPAPFTIAEQPFLRALSQMRAAHILADPAGVGCPCLCPNGAIGSWMGAALRWREHVLGYLVVGSCGPEAFTERQAKLLTAFAGQAALAVQNARLFREVQRLATVDPLTGLTNRRHFTVSALREIHRASRSGSPLACLMLDIDHFKHINDTYGHAAGDAALQQIARCCARQLRPYDVIARYGGEEFVLLLPQTDGDGAVHVAERLREHVEGEPILIRETVIPLTVSIGSSSLTLAGRVDDAHAEALLTSLVDDADRALYTAKEAGRNRVVRGNDAQA
ncbi:MAG: GGDEF domain-containing protein [Armatimonadota bacterium]